MVALRRDKREYLQSHRADRTIADPFFEYETAVCVRSILVLQKTLAFFFSSIPPFHSLSTSLCSSHSPLPSPPFVPFPHSLFPSLLSSLHSFLIGPVRLASLFLPPELRHLSVYFFLFVDQLDWNRHGHIHWGRQLPRLDLHPRLGFGMCLWRYVYCILCLFSTRRDFFCIKSCTLSH